MLAELAVVDDDRGAAAGDRTLPFDDALRLMPADLVTPTSAELLPGNEVELPGLRHRLRWDQPDVDGQRMVGSRITVVCDPTRPVEHEYMTRGSGHGAPGRANVVFTGLRNCDLREHYHVDVVAGTSTVALIEDTSWGCIDYSIALRRAHLIDLGRACE